MYLGFWFYSCTVRPTDQDMIAIKKIVWELLWWHSGWDSTLPMQGAWVRSLVRELDPTCMLQLRVRVPQLRSCMRQLRSPGAATREPACRS